VTKASADPLYAIRLNLIEDKVYGEDGIALRFPVESFVLFRDKKDASKKLTLEQVLDFVNENSDPATVPRKLVIYKLVFVPVTSVQIPYTVPKWKKSN